jgi:flagellar hook-associated protein 1
MADLSKMMEVARSALYTYRAALDVTSQNIANAQSEGYTRQVPNVEPSVSIKTPYGYLGSGVEITNVQRLRDTFLDQEIRNTNYNYGSANNQTEILDRVQSYLNEPIASGISTELDNFFEAWQNLSSNTEDSGVRQTVIEQGTTLSKEINYLANGFENVKSDILTEAQGKVKEINNLTNEIASLNKQIFLMSPSSVNELEDRRDTRIDELSKLIDIRAVKDANGLYNISSGGSTLISGVDSFQLKIRNQNSKVDVVYADSGMTVNSLVGELGADINSYNNIIPDFQSKLDAFTQKLISQVNSVHKTGYGLASGTSTTAPTGNDFFSGTDAKNMKVNEAVQNDVTLLAASKDGKAGNNEIALEIADLTDKPIFNNETTSLVQYYRSLVTDIGYSASDAQSSSSALETRLSNLEDLKSSTSGVSLDDEMVNLIKYQRAFDAASKIVTTVDQMYETILNLKG